MVFSSMVFLCVFLPAVFLMYQLVPGIRAKNGLLLLASLFFYGYGEPVYVFLLLGTAFFNYLAALLIGRRAGRRRIWLAAAAAINLGSLCVFKYTGFLLRLFAQAFGVTISAPEIRLPVGISFFTFQALSYVIDVYRGEEKPQENFGELLLYISFFPQLIAGPIVKYRDIASELTCRSQTAEDIVTGIRRFTLGLAKKVLIANVLAQAADTAFGADPGAVNMGVAWLGAVSYMLQIYFDFSGYSDMAIGLGRMFGFHFKENFKYPYSAGSIKEFWKRWHISLSGWFRDYLYIPLGGNRKGKRRTVFNKFLVFFCTGIWHGANVTFLFWGLYHGFFLTLEEYVPLFHRNQKGMAKVLMHGYTLLVVLVGFVFFRADTMTQALWWLRQMAAGVSGSPEAVSLLWSLLTPANLIAMAVGIAASAPWKKDWKWRAEGPVSLTVSLALYVVCLLNLSGGTYNPFIYFRF